MRRHNYEVVFCVNETNLCGAMLCSSLKTSEVLEVEGGGLVGAVGW